MLCTQAQHPSYPNDRWPRCLYLMRPGGAEARIVLLRWARNTGACDIVFHTILDSSAEVQKC